ncbi:hypothetical protein QTN47_27245 [Danxiaibacter flavus]|uniref:HNH endonuclease n=1 Tax=Danxiaibacter flavus TaxID=3049108 RepID=A0ABV3ZNP7_9BACT|nr:hypothetical protein QNM32_27245 [Chitinophagaceae bacterium DXS]
MTPFMQALQAKKAFGKATPEPKKEVKAIPKVAKKRAKDNREYAKVSRPVWKGKLCQIRSPVCTKHAEGFNHAGGKETKEKLLDIANGQAACNACNEYCEQHHEWAVKNGLRIKRNT